MPTPHLRITARLTLSMLMGLAAAALTPSLAHSAPSPTKSAYRCTTPQGGVSYSQQPCANGSDGRLVNAQDDRTEAQRQQAHDAVERDKALATEQARQAQQASEHAVKQHPNNLSGKVRQVSVGQREVDRRGIPAEPLKHNARQFRAKAPRKVARSASAPG